ncbi:MAG: TetR/AcrR family transcriptional regulator [Terriglobia bacterium]
MARPRTARVALLAAAERIFAERGLAGARTEEIAAAAHCNKALLHYYFETKEKLHQAVLENLFLQFSGGVKDVLADTRSPRRTLFTYLDLHFTFLQQHPNYPRLFQREMMSGAPHLRALVRRHLRPVYRGLARVLLAGMRRGEFRRVDIDNTVVSLIAMTVFYFAAAPVLSVVLEADVYEPRRVAARKRAVVDFVSQALLRPRRRRARRTT